MKYNIELEKTVSMVVVIEADDPYVAMVRAEEMHADGWTALTATRVYDE